MWEERFRQAIRLRLLVFVLAFALTWYALNPAPVPVQTGARETEPPDENRREAKSGMRASCDLEWVEAEVKRSSVVKPSSRTDEAGELEWPEIIDNA
jgi:hypothetical protein